MNKMADRSKNKMPGIGDRIKAYRIAWDFTQRGLAEILNKSESTVRMWELGKSEPDLETLTLIARHFCVTVDDLIGINTNPTIPGSSASKNRNLKVPVLGYVAAGIPMETIQNIIDYEEIPQQLARDGSEYFALQIKGDSMEPKISDGDVVIVRKQPDCDSGQIAIVCVNGDHATCKKIMKQQSGILLKPLNPDYDPTFYTNEEIRDIPITILGRVVELRAKF